MLFGTFNLKKLVKRSSIWVLQNPLTSALIFLLISWICAASIEVFVEKDAAGHNIDSFGDAIWWGIVTFLTVGYGDKYPVTGLGRFFAALLMIAGVVGIAIVTAKISSFFLEKALRERRGRVETDSLRNHFVVCGWKEEMANLLLQILRSNRSLNSADLVLLNNAPESEIESLLETPGLEKVKFVRGDFYLEINLRRVAPERAQKILILADATPNAKGEIPTVTEADARTVMTAMTLNNIAKGTLVAAEILDSAMDQYLRLAHVSEIIYSRSYSRLILAKASMGTGVTNVFHELLDPSGEAFLTTVELPEDVVGETYESLVAKIQEKRPQCLVIGLLENSGNSFVAKEKALRKAQLTPNISELVKNLQEVKAIQFNRPVFGPPLDYRVSDGALAIVIERHGGAHA